MRATVLPEVMTREFVQMGNCDSPIELDNGWLVPPTGWGGVGWGGVVRNYFVGASLLDKTDPCRLLARLGKPLLEPTDKERDGYLPKVVYSSAAKPRDRTLLLSYGKADNFASFATVSVDDLLKGMT